MIEKHSAIHTTRRDGKTVDGFTLAAGPLRARIITLGGTITHLFVPDRDGKVADVTLGFDDVGNYERPDNPYFGALIGRYGNRIAKGQFSLNGKTYSLATNNGANHLHGGLVGYGQRVWNVADAATTADGAVLTLKLHDADGTEGYPGTLDVAVTYTLTPDATLRIDYAATASGLATPVNLTNHAYFNLRDGGASPNHDHVLEIDAHGYTPVNDELIPTGEVAPVDGTPFDFTLPKPIGRDVAKVAGDPGGYDHNFVLRSGDHSLARGAKVVEPTTGRTMECWTTEPAVQFYGGNFLNGTLVGKNGVTYQKHAGFCLETQRYPDSPNQPRFPNTILQPGQTYRSRTEYRFGIKG